MTTAIGQYVKDLGLERRWRIWLECKQLEGAIGEELGVYIWRVEGFVRRGDVGGQLHVVGELESFHPIVITQAADLSASSSQLPIIT